MRCIGYERAVVFVWEVSKENEGIEMKELKSKTLLGYDRIKLLPESHMEAEYLINVKECNTVLTLGFLLYLLGLMAFPTLIFISIVIFGVWLNEVKFF